jgi:hypothetical protein
MSPVNARMVAILIRKDLSLLGLPVLGYVLAGLLGIGLMTLDGRGWFDAGCVVLITVLFGLGLHPCMATVVSERKEQTLAFVMSLPITPRDHTVAKIAVNLLMFFVPWSLLAAATAAVVLARPSVPDGLLPFGAILFGALAVVALVVLAVAVATESIPLTIGAEVSCNLLFHAVLFTSARMPAIGGHKESPTPVWNEQVALYLGAELALGVLFLAAAVWLRSRKTDFL